MYNYLKLVQRKEEEKLRILLTACQDQIAFVIVCEYISKYWKWKEKILWIIKDPKVIQKWKIGDSYFEMDLKEIVQTPLLCKQQLCHFWKEIHKD